MNSIRVVLFDLGGVLVELTGVPKMLEWMGDRVTAEELWARWLSSAAVRAFERGQCDPASFAEQLILEMDLPVKRDEFLIDFASWVKCLIPGACELVRSIPSEFVTATLCNTNAIHWPRIMNDLGLDGVFDHYFASHLTGKIKPDMDAFGHVVEMMGCDASAILFIDDNEINVDAAREFGMNAVRARGVAEARSAVENLIALDGSGVDSGA